MLLKNKGVANMLKVQEIREIIKLIDDSSINEFTYETDGTKVSMKKSLDEKEKSTIEQKTQTQPQKEEIPTKENVNVEDETTVKVASTNKTTDEPKETDYDYEIQSPMVGTFYSSPDPESDAYVKVGDSVKNDTVVCIVEAMKLFNEIEAETTGEIVEILVENGELVEYGQPLFRVKTK